MAFRPRFIGLFALTALTGGVAGVGTVGPAAAQGGIVCAYGPASYRACCKQSYAANPKLGARARADDIDACMGKGSAAKKKKQQQQQQPSG